MLVALVSLLLAAPPPSPTSTPPPPPATPAPDIRAGSAARSAPTGPRSLQDFARERRTRPKATPGSISTYAGSVTPGETAAEETPAPDKKRAGASDVKVGAVLLGSLAGDGSATFSGTLRNVGRGPACQIRVAVEILDEVGLTIATTEVVVDGPVIPGQERVFEGTLSVPRGSVTKAEASLGDGGAGRIAIEHGGKIVKGLSGKLAGTGDCEQP